MRAGEESVLGEMIEAEVVVVEELGFGGGVVRGEVVGVGARWADFRGGVRLVGEEGRVVASGEGSILGVCLRTRGAYIREARGTSSPKEEDVLEEVEFVTSAGVEGESTGVYEGSTSTGLLRFLPLAFGRMILGELDEDGKVEASLGEIGSGDEMASAGVIGEMGEAEELAEVPSALGSWNDLLHSLHIHRSLECRLVVLLLQYLQ